MRKSIFLLIIAVTTAGCNKQPNNVYDENAAKEKFCSYLNEENIDQTIPIVNEYLSRLEPDLDDEQQLQELVEWLQSCPCIIDVWRLNGVPPLPIYQITFSFDESRITKNFIMDISMSHPLKTIGYHLRKDENWADRIAYIQLQEATQDGLIYDVYTTMPGLTYEYAVEYEEVENNTIKVDILHSLLKVNCPCTSLTTVSIKKDTYTKAIISATGRYLITHSDGTPDSYEYRLIDTREISLPKTKK